MTTPAQNVDTTGVYGQTGAIPLGTQATSGAIKDTTEMGAGGSTTARPGPPTLSATPDTEGTNGSNLPENFTPVSTLLGATLDTTQGFAGNMSNPAYRAPGATVAATIKDTTNALGFAAAVPTDTYQWVTTGTTETASFGAPGGVLASITDTLTISSVTPAAATKTGVVGAAASLVVVNTGQVLTVTDESHTLTGLNAFTLTNNGVTDAITAVVVKKGATTLVKDTDYTIAATGSGASRNMSITPIDSVTVNSGDTLLVTYHYGNAAYFTPVALALTTDYTVTFTGQTTARTFTVLRVGASSNVANGDAVTVTYQYADAAYWGSHDAGAVPPAPVIGTAVAGDRKVKVVWALPTFGASGEDYDGFVIQSDTGGTRYAPGGTLSFLFETVVPGQAYTFRVAGFNEKGLGAFSSWSNAVTPLNYDVVPSGGLDPKNTVNYIYNADGTTVPGTGLGPS